MDFAHPGVTVSPMQFFEHAPASVNLMPSELEMLQGIFDQICQLRRIGPESAAAGVVARRLIDLFQHGIRNERQLLVMLSGSGNFP